MCKETVGFPGHFPYSLNTEELKHFGLGVWMGTLSLEAFPEGWWLISGLLFCFSTPFLCCRVLSSSRIEVSSVRKSPSEFKAYTGFQAGEAKWEKDTALLGFPPANEMRFIRTSSFSISSLYSICTPRIQWQLSCKVVRSLSKNLKYLLLIR